MIRHIENSFKVFTDGSCWPNPGNKGGWAYIIKDYSGVLINKSAKAYLAENVTNNKMELMAAIEGLKFFSEPKIIELITDSEYLGKGITTWMHQWKKTGWKQKNGDLWKEIYELVNYHTVYVTCIRGHQGQEENEECDKMASEVVKCLNI